MSKRLVNVSAQDFCNLMEGGLVSFSTLSSAAISSLNDISCGSFVCSYEFSPQDVLHVGDKAIQDQSIGDSTRYTFHAACWRGVSQTINVMCSRIGKFLIHFELFLFVDSHF